LNIQITEHICLRYIERFNPNLAAIDDIKERLNRAKIAIKSIMESARYVSDDERGILLYSPLHKCNLIVRKRKLITLYHPNGKCKDREKKYKSSPRRRGVKGIG